MLDKFYDEMDKFMKELGINVKDTDNKQEIINSQNFVAIFITE